MCPALKKVITEKDQNHKCQIFVLKYLIWDIGTQIVILLYFLTRVVICPVENVFFMFFDVFERLIGNESPRHLEIIFL